MKNKVLLGCALVVAVALPVLLSGCAIPAVGANTIDVDNQVIQGTKISYGKPFSSRQDIYLDIRRSASQLTTGTIAPHPNEAGRRVVFGPDPQVFNPTAVSARLASEMVTDPASNVTENVAILELDDGYAAIWGWRPRVRMQRIIAGSDGTTLIVQFRGSGSTLVERVYVLDKPGTSPVKVFSKSNPTQLLKSWSGNDSYVDFSGPYATPGPMVLLSTDSAARMWVDLVRKKMK